VGVFRFIATGKAEHSVKTLCRVLGVSRSGFHAWERRAPSDRDLADACLSERIRGIHAQSRQTYGARHLHAALRHRGLHVGRKRVERLMRRLGLSGPPPEALSPHGDDDPQGVGEPSVFRIRSREAAMGSPCDDAGQHPGHPWIDAPRRNFVRLVGC
jgi:hypothetical protein